MIHLCREPNFPLEIISPSLAEQMSEHGCSTCMSVIGRDGAFQLMRSFLPRTFSQSVFSFLQTHFLCTDALSRVHRGDLVMVYETASIANRFADAAFQRAAVRKGAAYIPIFPDAWPLVKGWLSDCCRRRVELATVVGCVTPSLVDLFRKLFPDKRIVLFEESVPTDAFTPDWNEPDTPVVCWSGPPSKIGEVEKEIPVLEHIYHSHPFILRIISGCSPPRFQTDIQIDWRPFSKNAYGQDFIGASIAFARYGDSPYNRCKGNYKIKTYMAAGCAIVTSPVGYNLDLIRPGETGLFAKTRDEWEQAFLRLLENPAERIAMRKAARAEAEKRFSFKAIARQYAGVFRSLSLE